MYMSNTLKLVFQSSAATPTNSPTPPQSVVISQRPRRPRIPGIPEPSKESWNPCGVLNLPDVPDTPPDGGIRYLNHFDWLPLTPWIKVPPGIWPADPTVSVPKPTVLTIISLLVSYIPIFNAHIPASSFPVCVAELGPRPTLDPEKKFGPLDSTRYVFS